MTTSAHPVRRGRLRRTTAAVGTAVALAVGACAGPATSGSTPDAAASGSASDVTTPWPAPWPERPVVTATVDMAADLASATGTESVVLRLDRPVCEVVFRAWPNTPKAAESGAALVVTAARVDGTSVAPRVESAGARPGSPGTLVTLPLPACVPAGTALTVELAFRLTLGQDADERVGYSSAANVAWWGSALPLPAWVRGVGWVRDAAVDLDGEAVTSEEFRLADLAVTTAADHEVVGVGTATGTTPAPNGRTTHHFTADAVRDVAVGVGRLDVVTRRVGEVTVHVGVPRSGSRSSADEWTDEIGAALPRLGGLFGPFPYPELWATIVPSQSDGVEFPTALQFGDLRPSRLRPLVAHELAHQWFYALVGNDQATDPWLDEAFATYAQALVADEEDQYRRPTFRGDLGRPMAYWAQRGDFDRYVRSVYDQGAAALLAGRRAVGAPAFDAAVRGYLHAQAHRVATPEAVERAFGALPAALEPLREAGAFTTR